MLFTTYSEIPNMTDSNFCCLCASDEGVFLEIFTATDRQLGNRSFLKEFETCLSVKVKQDEALSSTICHRCAIELGQCNQFVEKYHRVYGLTLKLKKTLSKASCCLCLSTAKKHHIFTLAKDFRSTIDPLQKIYECFNRRITREEAENLSICLLCRYNLDVLYDLRTLVSEVTSKLKRIAESKAILANLPKTKTFVVNRKTTVISQSKIELEILSNSDSECHTMSRKRSRPQKLENLGTPVELKLRTCGQCHTSIEGGIDMYRLHSTGVTVCKMCWITMDPFNPSRANKRKRQNQAHAKNTRLCAVFLKDVLSPASSRDNESPKIEKNKQEEVICITSSDNDSYSEEKSDVEAKKSVRSRLRSRAIGSGAESDTNLGQRLKRNFKLDEADSNSGSNKKLKPLKNEDTTVFSGLRRSARYQSSDSDSVKTNSKKSRVVNKAKSSAKINDVHSGHKIKPNKNQGKRKGGHVESVESKSEDSASSGEGGVKKKLRKVRNKVPLILKPELPDSQEGDKNLKRSSTRTPAPNQSPKISKKSSLQSLKKIRSSRIRLSPNRAKSLMMVSFPFKLKHPYECKVCRTEYRNKVIGMKHELTHFKQLEIKIEKLNINHHFQKINENSTTTELPDASCSVDLTTTNEKPLQPVPLVSTSPLEDGADRGKESDHETKEGESVQRSETPESIQKDDKSPDIHDAKETEAVDSLNGPLTEESTLVATVSKTKTVENSIPVSESTDELKKVNTSSAKADSVPETNFIDKNDEIKVRNGETKVENGEGRESNETVIKNNKGELAEEVERTSNNVDGKEDAEKKSDEDAITPSPKIATGKDVERDRDSGEKMESDIDIRIVDSGSSAEDSREQMEKSTDDTKKVSSKTDTEEEVMDSKEELKLKDDSKEALNEELEADITSTIKSDNNIDAKDKTDDVSLQDKQENEKESESSELSKKIEEDVRPPTAVTEILQEVIDLATAEVQKRVESEVVSVPETVENISEEIKKTTVELPAAPDKVLASSDAVTNKETESCELDSDSTTNSLKNDLDVNTTDV